MTMELASAKYLEQTQDDQSVADALAEQNAAIKKNGPIRKSARRNGNATSEWSGRLTTICLALMFFGLTGFLWSAFTVVALLGGPQEIKSHRNMTPAMVAKAAELQKQMVVPQLFLSIVKMGVGAMLGLSGMLMFAKRRNSRQLAVNSCYAAIGSHLLAACISAWAVVSMSSIAKEAALMRYSKEQVSTFLGVYSFGAVIGLGVVLIFFGILYAAIAIHLNSPGVRRIFGENPFPEKEDLAKRVQQGMPASCM